MDKKDKDWLESMISSVSIPSEDIPDIELYMDQVTTFMDTRLDPARRYPDDKILTRTMINNYTKNRLLPPSVKKKYSKEHIYMLIFIYHLKNMLSISDIQTLLEPLADSFFYGQPQTGLSLKDIYDRVIGMCSDRFPDIESDLLNTLECTENSFEDSELTEEEDRYLDYFSFIYQLCYDIYIRKQLIERLIDNYRDTHKNEKGKKKKNS